jgi:hypothetical protein
MFYATNERNSIADTRNVNQPAFTQSPAGVKKEHHHHHHHDPRIKHFFSLAFAFIAILNIEAHFKQCVSSRKTVTEKSTFFAFSLTAIVSTATCYPPSPDCM